MSLDRIQSFLVNKHIKVPEDWIEQCLEYIRTEINVSIAWLEPTNRNVSHDLTHPIEMRSR